MGLPLWL